MALNVFFWVPILLVVACARLLIPVSQWRIWSGRLMTSIAEAWISGNCLIFSLMGVLRVEAHGAGQLNPQDWYLVLSNHRSWVDILVLQKVFNRRVPLLKFFLKQPLIWVPLLGLAWWALEFPFMRRHTAAYLAAHPEARGQDLAATRRACERFALIPTSIMNFVEGTRFTQAKRIALKSPYRHLLPPRAGGVAFVLAAMGGILHSMLDVTIAYSDSGPTLWDLCCGRLGPVHVSGERRPIEPWTTAGDYTADEDFRRRFQAWLSGIWADKDRKLDEWANS
jgi:1-acyl-sn-glycerol-3-phosphate acyltransferase